MQAVVRSKYGLPEVLQLQEIEKPTPKAGEVLVKIHAASVNTADWYALLGKPFIARLMGGIFSPKHKILGVDIAGIVVSAGSGATRLKPGDAVFGDISACGGGGFAEYAAVPETALVSMPANLSFEQAAAVPMAAVTALQGLRGKGDIRAGQKVLINGASGGVGTFAIQIAKAFGAEVTAICSARNMDQARSLGADHVIDYSRENFTQNGQHYDLIIGANGYHPLADYKCALTPEGIYVCTGGTMKQIFQPILLGPVLSLNSKKKLGSLTAAPNANDLAYVKTLLEQGKVMPVIDRCYPLRQTADALGYVGQKHARGKVIIAICQDGE